EMEYEPSKNLRTYLNENISIFGENIRLSRVEKCQAGENEVIFDYLHFNYRVGVIVLIGFEKSINENAQIKEEFGTKTAFQIASMKPVYVDISSIPSNEIEESKKIAFEQAKSEGKPEHVAQKIAEGKVLKMMEDNVLMEQSFYDESLKLPKFKDYVKSVSSNLKENIVIKKFARFEIGR
ncbi:MAG: hypothetical protein ACK4GR_02030, partial [bacterium]